MGRRLALVASEHPPVSLPPPSPSGPAHRGWPLTVATSGSPTTAMVRCRKSRSGNAAVHCAGRGNSRQPTCQRRTGVYDAPRTPGTGVRSRISVCILFTQRWLVPLRVHSQRGVTQHRPHPQLPQRRFTRPLRGRLRCPTSRPQPGWNPMKRVSARPRANHIIPLRTRKIRPRQIRKTKQWHRRPYGCTR